MCKNVNTNGNCERREQRENTRAIGPFRFFCSYENKIDNEVYIGTQLLMWVIDNVRK